MVNELKIDPKLVEEFLNINKNIFDAPKLVRAPDEINLDMTPYDVAYSEDKIRLLHFHPTTERQVKTPLVIVYAFINQYQLLYIHLQKRWVRYLYNDAVE